MKPHNRKKSRLPRLGAKIGSKPRRSTPAARYQIEPLEQRILLSGDPLLGGAQAMLLQDMADGTPLFAEQREVFSRVTDQVRADLTHQSAEHDHDKRVDVTFAVDAAALETAAADIRHGYMDGVLEIEETTPPGQLSSLQPGMPNAGGSFFQDDRLHLMDNAHLTGDVHLTDGQVLSGTGTINGWVENYGLISPGNSPGSQVFDSLTLADGGTLLMEIGGTAAGSGYDQIHVSGDVQLGGLLDIRLWDGFVPEVGQRFDLITWDAASQVTGSFDDIDGLYGFGNGSAYFNISLDEDSLTLEVAEAPGFSLISDDAADQIGLFLNEDVPGLSWDSITFNANLNIGDFLYLGGEFTFSLEESQAMDVAYSLGGVVSDTFEDIDMAVWTLTLTDGYAFAGYAGGAQTLFSGDPGIRLEADELSETATGFLLNDIEMGLAMLHADVPLVGLATPFFYAGSVSVGEAVLVGLDGIDLSAQGIEVLFNTSDESSLTIDWASSTNGAGYAVVVDAERTVTLDYDADAVIGVYVDQGTLRVDDFLYVTGAFAFEQGNSAEVAVAYNIGGVTSGTTSAVMDFMTVGVSDAYGFAGYISDGGAFGSDANGDGRIGLDEVNSTATGFAINDLDFGMIMASASSVIEGTYIPSMSAVRINVGEVGLVGLDFLDLSAAGVEVRLNQAGVKGPLTTTINWAGSFADAGGYEIPAGNGNTMLIDYGAGSLTGLYADQATLRIDDFLYVTGAFAYEKGPSAEVDISYTTLGMNESSTWAPMKFTTLGVSDAYGFAGYISDGGAFGSDANGDGRIGLDEVNSTATGFAINDLDFGMIVATPKSLIDGVFLPSMSAARVNVGEMGLVGLDFVDLKGEGIEVKLNRSGSKGPIEATIDWAASFADTGGYEIPAGNGNSVVIDYDADAFTGVYVEKATLRVDDFFYVTGAFAFEKGKTEEVVVNYEMDGFSSTADTTTLNMNFMTIGVANAFGFIGYIGDGGEYMLSDDGDGVIEDGEINATAIGFALNDLDFGMVTATPDSSWDDLFFPSMSAIRASVGQVGLIGIDAFELSAEGVEIKYNQEGSTGPYVMGIDWQASFGEQGFEVPTGGAPVYIDYEDGGFMGLYTERATLKIDDFLYVTGAFAFEQGNSAVVDIETDFHGITTRMEDQEVDLMTVGVANA